MSVTKLEGCRPSLQLEDHTPDKRNNVWQAVDDATKSIAHASGLSTDMVRNEFFKGEPESLRGLLKRIKSFGPCPNGSQATTIL